MLAELDFNIWVDADACPNPIKELIFRASNRLKITTTLVANDFLRRPVCPHVYVLQVSKGFDVADSVILDRMSPGDLVVTQDVPLASAVVDLGGVAINPRGTWYDHETVRTSLRRRNEREELREAGLIQGGPAPFSTKDIQRFARTLDQFLAKQK